MADMEIKMEKQHHFCASWLGYLVILLVCSAFLFIPSAYASGASHMFEFGEQILDFSPCGNKLAVLTID